MPRQKSLSPGSCTLRLTNITTLPPSQKAALISSIANDIKATFIYIAKQSEAGNLGPHNTAPLDDVVATIRDTAVSERRMLEKKLEKTERRVRMLKREQKWMQKEFGEVMKRVEMVSGKWKEKIERLRGRVEGLQRELASGRKGEMVERKGGEDKA
ncbi:uncharacterized protein ASPGLDRAFT_1494480 [Aspergillus glaucus CBS 516.65]|uniref:Uncharacterized protein n=1 Tax=Aspergillus glaucus CBS 516.65 TaxID=1160497 RepID=A0A1L9VFP8_ASPGL|nr:hypothetical protein ASPGLDRAFT_1494480 [Aspergillus glaucus CBS 516.65]OJJ82652.1 hypothetical protein ASPGLDRAFT_1494480 [Aspergillus glaucus CBS 516.65]